MAFDASSNAMTLDDGKLLSKLVGRYEAAVDASLSSFEKAERDQDYYDGKQLTDDEHNALKARGQPPVVINLIRRKIDFLMGIEARQRSDPKAFPRTPADRDSAEVVTDTLRYVADATDFNQVRSRVWKDLLVPGWGGYQVITRGARRPDPIAAQFGMEPNPDVIVQRTPWDRMFWDPYSSGIDFEDARYRGLVVWKDQEDAINWYPEREDIINAAVNDARGSETYDDKPKKGWADFKRKRVRIVQIWWKQNNTVMWADIVKNGILDMGESPYVNEFGEPSDNFVWRSAYVDRDNNRHGVVRDMIDPQDEVNKRRSKSLHLLNTRQVISEEGAVHDKQRAKKELARPDGWIEKTPGMSLDIIQNSDLSAGQMQLLQHATSELEKMGPNESLQGAGSASSGRELQARQQGGMVELGAHLDGLRAMDRDCYRTIWGTCQRSWSAPQFVRITDRDDAPRFVGLNEPLIDKMGQVVGYQNQTAQMYADIVVEDAPDVSSIEQEVWAELSNLIPTLAGLPPHWSELVVEASPLPQSRKRRILELLKQQGQQPQDPAKAQIEQEAIEIGKAEKIADIEKKRADAAKSGAQAAQIAQETEIQAVDAAQRLAPAASWI